MLILRVCIDFLNEVRKMEQLPLVVIISDQPIADQNQREYARGRVIANDCQVQVINPDRATAAIIAVLATPGRTIRKVILNLHDEAIARHFVRWARHMADLYKLCIESADSSVSVSGCPTCAIDAYCATDTERRIPPYSSRRWAT